jgi:hypothetical protein
VIGWLFVLLLSGQLDNALVAYRAAQAIGDYNKQRAYHQGKRLGSNAKAAMVVRYRIILSCAGLLCAQNLSVTVVSAQGFTQPKNYIPTSRVQVWNQPGQENTYHTGVQEWNQKRTANGHPALPTEPPVGAEAPVAQPKRPVAISVKPSSATSGAVSSAQRKQKALDAYTEAQRNLEKARIQEYYEERAKREIEVGKQKARQIIDNAPPAKPQVWSRSTDDGYVPLSERIPGYVPYSIREGQRPGNLGTGPVKPNADSIYTSPTLEAARMHEQMAQERADVLRQKSKEKQALVDQSMDNFKSQMKNSKVPGAAKLQNNGSNLYVRYYGGAKGK